MTATPSRTTTEDLAQLGDSIQEAQRERAAREARQRRDEHQRARCQRRVAKLDPPISAIAGRVDTIQNVVDARLKERTELAALIESTATPPTSDIHRLAELDEALHQATTTGAPVVHGVSVHEQSGAPTIGTPMRVRQPHPLLLEANPDPDFWANGLETLRDELDRLRADRDAAQRQLESLASR